MIVDTLTVLSSAVVMATSSPTPEQSISKEQLEMSVTNNVADVLKMFAGVQLKDYGGVGGMKTINVRSMGMHHTGVYIDGVRITNCQNGTVDLSKYSIQNMESVELYNGSKLSSTRSATEYSLQSSVYFRTKCPSETSASVKYSVASFNTNKASVYLSLKDKAFIDAEVLKTKGNYKFRYKSQYEDTVGVRRNSDIRYLRLETGYFNKYLRVHGYFYTSDRGLPGGVVKRLSDKYADIGREQDKNAFIQASTKFNYEDWLFITNHKVTYDKLHANTNYIENQFARYDNSYTQSDLYNSYVVSYNKPSWYISQSTDIRRSTLSCNVKHFRYVTRLDIRSSLAVKYAYHGLSVNGVLLYTNSKDHSVMHTADRLVKLSPALYLSYQSTKFSYRAFFKQSFRTPTLNDYYYVHVGVRTLKPELTYQYNVGVTYLYGNVNVQFDAYHTRAKDKIVCIPSGSAYDWKMMNKGEVKTYGVDISAKYCSRNIDVLYSLSYQDARDYSDKRDTKSYGHQLLYSPKWSQSYTAIVKYKQFSVTLSTMFVSDRWWSYASEKDKLKSYASVDTKLQYKSKHATVSLNVNNILDTHYELIQRWPLPGRQTELSIKLSI